MDDEKGRRPLPGMLDEPMVVPLQDPGRDRRVFDRSRPAACPEDQRGPAGGMRREMIHDAFGIVPENHGAHDHAVVLGEVGDIERIAADYMQSVASQKCRDLARQAASPFGTIDAGHRSIGKMIVKGYRGRGIRPATHEEDASRPICLKNPRLESVPVPVSRIRDRDRAPGRRRTEQASGERTFALELIASPCRIQILTNAAERHTAEYAAGRRFIHLVEKGVQRIEYRFESTPGRSWKRRGHRTEVERLDNPSSGPAPLLHETIHPSIRLPTCIRLVRPCHAVPVSTDGKAPGPDIRTNTIIPGTDGAPQKRIVLARLRMPSRAAEPRPLDQGVSGTSTRRAGAGTSPSRRLRQEKAMRVCRQIDISSGRRRQWRRRFGRSRPPVGGDEGIQGPAL